MASVDLDVIRIEARLAEVTEAKRLAEARVKELTEALTAARAAEAVAKQADEEAGLETILEALSWITAKSGRCDYVRDAPPALVERVRAKGKDGVKGTLHHFTASSSEPTIFRFKRAGV